MIQFENGTQSTAAPETGYTQSTFHIAKPLVGMKYLSEVLLQTGENDPPASIDAVLDPEKEKLLRDVLYTVDSLIGKTGSWEVSNTNSSITNNWNHGRCLASDGVSRSSVVSAEEISSLLEKVFNTDPETIQRLRDETNERKRPHFCLDLTVVEADIKSQKDSEETTNSHIRVQTIPKSSNAFNTPQIKDSIRPKWKHNIKLKLTSVYSDRILLELWQEREEVRVRKRDQIRRRHQDLAKNLLLAELQLHLKDTLEPGINGWYDMENRLGTNMSERSRVRLLGHIINESEVEWRERASYDALVRILYDPQKDKTTQKEQNGPCGSSIKESLSPAAKTVLCQHALILNLRQSSQLLSLWCNVTVISCPLDWHLVITQFKQITASLVMKMFTAEEEQRLSQALSEVIYGCIKCLANLEVSFPISSPDRSRLQLTSLLQTIKIMEDHPSIRPLVKEEKGFCFKTLIKVTLQGFFRKWWNDMDHVFDKCSTTKDKLDATLTVTSGLVELLQRFARFYDEIFKKEIDICCLKVLYQATVKDVMDAIEPVIIECCQYIPKSVESIGENGIDYDFLRGSNLMKIYKNLIKICGKWCPHLTAGNLESSGVEEYHTYFEAGFENQLALTTDRESRLIREVILKDNLQPLDLQTPYSASLMEATAIPHRMKIWWFDLVWPNAGDRVVHLIRVLKSLISLNITYCQNLVAQLESVVQNVEGSDSELFINNKVCVVITNIEKQIKELERYPDILGYKSLESQTNGRHSEEIQSIIDNAILSIQKIIKLFMVAVLEKKEKFLEKSIVTTCQKCGRLTFLVEVVYPAIDLLRKSLTVATCHQFFQCFWNNVLKVMRNIIKKDPSRNCDFYGNMLKILQNIYDDLTPETEEALDTQSAKTEEYVSLVEDLELLQQSSASLINSYDHERRHQQQQDDSIPQTASMTIRTWFKEGISNRQVVIYVLMAKDIVVPPKEAHKAPLEYYVSVRILRLLPPLSSSSSEQQHQYEQYQVKEMTTQIIKEDPATFDAELEFDLDNHSEEDFQNGLIQITLKDRNLTRKDTLLGESYVLLRDAAEGKAEAQNLNLKLVVGNLLGSQRCQRILQILGKRDSDRQANAFIKTIKKRHGDDFSDLLKRF